MISAARNVARSIKRNAVRGAAAVMTGGVVLASSVMPAHAFGDSIAERVIDCTVYGAVAQVALNNMKAASVAYARDQMPYGMPSGRELAAERAQVGKPVTVLHDDKNVSVIADGMMTPSKQSRQMMKVAQDSYMMALDATTNLVIRDCRSEMKDIYGSLPKETLTP